MNLRVYLMTYSLTTQHFIKIPEDTIGLVGFGVVAATALSSQKNKQYIQKAIEVYNEKLDSGINPLSKSVAT